MNQRTSFIMIAASIFLVALACDGCSPCGCSSCNGSCTYTPPPPPPTNTPNAAEVAQTIVQECLRCGTQVAGIETYVAENGGESSSDPDYSAWLTVTAPGYCAKQFGCMQALSAPLSNTITIHTVTPQAPAASCIPAPTLTDPLAGKPAAVTSLTLAWTSDYALQPGEMFDVLVSPNASDLVATSDANQPAIIGRTTDKSLPIDLLKWKYAGTLGRFYWGVRIADAGGIFQNCAAEPASFMLIAPPTATPFVCVTAPVLFDPPDGRTFATKNTILRWRTDYALKPDEEFGVLAWMEGDAQPTLLTKTRDMTAPIDLLQWAFAGRFGKFLWNVRLQRTDGTVLSCPSPAFSFTLTGYPSGPVPVPPGPPCIYTPGHPCP